MNIIKTMNMKTVVRIALVAAVVALVAGCTPGGDTPQDLVNKFISYANADNYSAIPGLLDPSASNYNQANASYWQSTLNPDYTSVSLSGDGPVTATAKDGSNTDVTLVFTFSGSEGNLFNDNDYKILTIKEGGSTIYQ